MTNEPLFATSVAGSLPKPAWLAEPEKLWPAWRHAGAALTTAQQDSALVWLKLQEDAGIDIARRTVAKYREELRILSSTKRKKLF